MYCLVSCRRMFVHEDKPAQQTHIGKDFTIQVLKSGYSLLISTLLCRVEECLCTKRNPPYGGTVRSKYLRPVNTYFRASCSRTFVHEDKPRYLNPHRVELYRSTYLRLPTVLLICTLLCRVKTMFVHQEEPTSGGTVRSSYQRQPSVISHVFSCVAWKHVCAPRQTPHRG